MYRIGSILSISRKMKLTIHSLSDSTFDSIHFFKITFKKLSQWHYKNKLNPTSGTIPFSRIFREKRFVPSLSVDHCFLFMKPELCLDVISTFLLLEFKTTIILFSKSGNFYLQAKLKKKIKK